MKTLTGKLFVIEGIDKSGKSILAKLLTEILQEEYKLNYQPIVYNQTSNEPEYKVKNGLYNICFSLFARFLSDFNTHPLTRSYMEYAGRNEAWHNIISKQLEEGRVLVCDRFYHSEYVYGIAGRNTDREWVDYNHKLTYGEYKPYATIILVPTRELFQANKDSTSEKLYMYDDEAWAFQSTLLHYYLYGLPKELDYDGRRFYLHISKHITKDQLREFCITNKIF